MSRLIFACLMLSVACASAGQLLLRVGAAGRSEFAAFINPWLLGGLALYGIGTVLWILVISRANLALAYPFTSLTVAVVYVSAAVLLREPISLVSSAGVALIVLGLVLIWRAA